MRLTTPTSVSASSWAVAPAWARARRPRRAEAGRFKGVTPTKRRIPSAALQEAAQRLLTIDPAAAESFDELHDLVAAAITDIHMIGPLTIYGTAHRIGAFLGLEPERFYLHCGTRDGARVIGLGPGHKTLEVDELPAEFRRLSAAEIEDCQCTYKERLTWTHGMHLQRASEHLGH